MPMRAETSRPVIRNLSIERVQPTAASSSSGQRARVSISQRRVLPGREAQVAGERDHCAVVGAQRCRRVVHVAGKALAERGAQARVRGDAAGHDQTIEARSARAHDCT